MFVFFALEHVLHFFFNSHIPLIDKIILKFWTEDSKPILTDDWWTEMQKVLWFQSTYNHSVSWAPQAKGIPEPEEAFSLASHGNCSSIYSLTFRGIVLSQGAATLRYKKAKESSHERWSLCPLQAVKHNISEFSVD